MTKNKRDVGKGEVDWFFPWKGVLPEMWNELFKPAIKGLYMPTIARGLIEETLRKVPKDTKEIMVWYEEDVLVKEIYQSWKDKSYYNEETPIVTFYAGFRNHDGQMETVSSQIRYETGEIFKYIERELEKFSTSMEIYDKAHKRIRNI